MPFGLHGGAATFQRLMDKVLQLMASFGLTYIDDIIFFRQMWEDHLAHLQAVLSQLREYWLTTNPNNCHKW